MGAAASIGSTPEEIAANKERLLKDLGEQSAACHVPAQVLPLMPCAAALLVIIKTAGEYEALRQAGISDAEIATKLEEVRCTRPLLIRPR